MPKNSHQKVLLILLKYLLKYSEMINQLGNYMFINCILICFIFFRSSEIDKMSEKDKKMYKKIKKKKEENKLKKQS